MNKNRILIIDDELNIRETINELLILKNYDTRTAINGQIGLDILENWTPDLIICDIMMPVMDGYSFQKIVHDDKLLSSIPFIFLTAKNENNLMRKCLINGADDFLTKPFKTGDLLKTIETKIDKFKKIKNTTNLYIGNKNHFSHEINTPLNSIIGSIDLLIKYPNEFKKSETSNFYEAIKISSERLNRTMQKIVLMENIKDNQFEVANGDFSEVKSTFKNVIKNLSLNYTGLEKRVVSKFVTSELEISKKNLDFILFELLDNALKFSPKNKKVTIDGNLYNTDYYEIRIFDFGVGFKEDELKMIDAAVQFNRDEKEQKGLGLGLYLSKSIIKKSNGIISILPRENEGTKINILLPIKKYI
ncbi:response regulator [Flavobacterium ovatum]|uniref:ATP-binding response regulator n=1 Tax=Flavobacterium ovatum TaxID=1928857 RepID=UPI00345082F9